MEADCGILNDSQDHILSGCNSIASLVDNVACGNELLNDPRATPDKMGANCNSIASWGIDTDKFDIKKLIDTSHGVTKIPAVKELFDAPDPAAATPNAGTPTAANVLVVPPDLIKLLRASGTTFK